MSEETTAHLKIDKEEESDASGYEYLSDYVQRYICGMLDHENPEDEGYNSSHAEGEAEYTIYELFAIRKEVAMVKEMPSRKEECYEYTTEDGISLCRYTACRNPTEWTHR